MTYARRSLRKLFWFSCIALISRGAGAQSWNKLDDVTSKLQDARTKLDVQTNLIRQTQAALNEITKITVHIDRISADRTVAADTKQELIKTRGAELAAQNQAVLVANVAHQVVSGVILPASTPGLGQALESIKNLLNPTLPLCGTTVSYRGRNEHVPWQASIDEFLGKNGTKLLAVGRLEMDMKVHKPGPAGVPIDALQTVPIGTGFAIGERRVATAGHVARFFWAADAKEFDSRVVAIYFNTGAEYNFNCPGANTGARRVRIGSVAEFSYEGEVPKQSPLDYAILELGPDESNLSNVLAISTDDKLVGSFVFTVGYPDRDGTTDKQRWAAAMSVPTKDGPFPYPGIKRIAPGLVTPTCSNASALHHSHDATTFNRNSGSPLINMAGDVVGIHVSGMGIEPDDPNYCNLALKSTAAPVLRSSSAKPALTNAAETQKP